jgi:diacylglycerol kinase family enzyme
VGGDLCRTLGGRADEARLRSAAAVRLPVDLGSVLVDGAHHWFVAHLVARRSWWHGRIVAAMNAEYLGRWDVAPRAHPGDGVLEVVDVSPSMSLRDRLEARARLPTGRHVPHPAVSMRRLAALQIDFEKPTPVWLDGVAIGAVRALSIRVEPDALVCVV